MTATLHRPAAPGQGPDRHGAGPVPTGPPRRPAGAVQNGSGQNGSDRAWIGPTLIAALSVIAGSLALTATISGTDWLLPLIEVVLITWLLGVGCRMLRSPAPITVLVQFAGLVIALTGLFTTSGWGGFLPNSAVMGEAGDLLSGAWEQILGTVPPAPSTVQLSFLICLTVGTTALIVDFLVAEARSPALVALPLLCLYSVPASIATEQLQWWTFVAPALFYALLLAVTGHIGTRTRGRTNATMLITAMVLAVVGSTIAVVIGDSVTSVGTEGRLPRSDAGGGDIGLSPFTSLRGNLNRDDPQDLLTVSGLDNGDYLRIVGLEQWTPGEEGGFTYSELGGDGIGDGVLPGRTPNPGSVPLRITSQQWASEFLPIYSGTESVSGLTDGWQYDQGLFSVHRDDRENPETYSLRASFTRPTADELQGDTVTPDEALVDTGDIPDSVVRIARDVTTSAGSPFAKADALLKYFTDGTNGFEYTLQVPHGDTGDPLSDFLTLKQGYCEQYATTMAVMLRSLDIPARVAVGFTQGSRQDDGSWLITTNDAHAWVEVRFDDHGWVRFDPTPLGSATGNEQGFSEAEAPEASPTGAPTAEASVFTSSESAEPSDSGADPQGNAQQIDDETDRSSAAAAGTAEADSGVPAQLWWVLLTLVLIAMVLAVPTVVRRLRRRRRLSTAGAGGPGAASAAWAEVEDLLVDHGLPLLAFESTRATANRLARSSRLSEKARQKLRSLVLAAEQEWYGRHEEPAGSSSDRSASGASAGSPAEGTTSVTTQPDGGELVAAVEAIAESLQRSAPLSPGDRLLPRSVRPSSRDS